MRSSSASPYHRTVDEVAPPELEVSVVLLEEEGGAYTEATVSMPIISSEVLGQLPDDAEAAARTGPSLVDTLLLGVEELLALGDVTSALELVGRAERSGADDARLRAARARCESAQREVWEARLGDLRQVPRLKLRMVELMKLSLDARMGFLLSRIDGHTSYEALFSVSGMSRQDTLRMLVRLWEQDVLTLSAP